MVKRCLQTFVLIVLFLLLSCPAVVQAEGWVERVDAPCSGGYGEAVVGTTDSIYVARCLYATRTPSFSRYDPDTDSWTSMSTTGLPTGAFRSGTALAWDHDNHIYALCGGRYSDSSRKLFYRYNISGNIWEQLADTPHAQGAGDAITWSEHDNHVYAMIGSNARGTVLARYSYDSWEVLTFNPIWTFTDDGASLASVGEHLYALRGEYSEHTPNGDFARYHIPTAAWTDMSDIPESEGIGDGGSLLYIGDWMGEHADHIFALGGGGVYEDPGYNFYRYSISGNDWAQLEQISCPIGFYVGNRLGYANNHIYYWQGSPMSDLWVCGGDAFYMFEWSPPNLTCICGDICVNENGWWHDDDAFNSNDTPIQAAVDTADAGETIYVWNGSYTENVDVDKQLTLEGEGAEVVIMTAASASEPVFEVTADYVDIAGFMVTGATGYSGAGVRLYNADHCNVSYNNVSNNNHGICLDSSGNNTLTSNLMSDNKYNFGVYGWNDSCFGNNIGVTNLVDGKPVYYIKSADDMTFDHSTHADAGTIYCIQCNNITIKNITLTNNSAGVFFWKTNNSRIENVNAVNNIYGIYSSHSSNNALEDNSASNNQWGSYSYHSSNNSLVNNTCFSNWLGILLWHLSNNTLTANMCSNNSGNGIILIDSSNNTLAGNTCSNNDDGGIVLMGESGNNLLYHNNFIDNNDNVYDFLYSFCNSTNFWNSSAEGNYYSDYAGCDNDTDGIGDAPHPIQGGGSVDHFPLMQPWSEDTQQKGDLDGDGQITAADVLIALQIAVRGEYRPEADMDENGYVNALDARVIMHVAV